MITCFDIVFSMREGPFITYVGCKIIMVMCLTSHNGYRACRHGCIWNMNLWLHITCIRSDPYLTCFITLEARREITFHLYVQECGYLMNYRFVFWINVMVDASKISWYNTILSGLTVRNNYSQMDLVVLSLNRFQLTVLQITLCYKMLNVDHLMDCRVH